MKLRNGFELQDICGEMILVATGEENIDFTKLITLNETAAFLWNECSKQGDFTVESLTNALCSEYNATAEQAENDIKELLKQWKEEGLLED